MKKLLHLLVAGTIAMAAVFSLGGTSPSANKVEDVSMETDAYLLENGFSEAFVEATDGETKQQLYEQNARMAGSMEFPVLKDWADFSGSLTIANIPEPEEPTGGYVTHKRLVFNWQWDTTKSDGKPHDPNGDIVSIEWTSAAGDLHLLPETAQFTLRGDATLVDSNIGKVEHPHPSEPVPPASMSDIVMLTQSGNECITHYVIARKLSYVIRIPEVTPQRFYFGRHWGDYQSDFRQYSGTFSIDVVQVFEKPNRMIFASADYEQV